MKRIKFLNLFIFMLTAVFLLGACGSEDGSNELDSSDNGSTSGERVELTIATWANATEADEFNEIIDRLNASQDVYTLTQEMIPSDYYTVVQTMIGGRQAPDLFWLAQEYIPAYATNDALIDLSDFLADQTQLDMDDFLEGVLNTAKYQGNIYGLPWIGQPFVVYYNADMFAEAGLDAPADDWTWEDFSEAAMALTGEDVYGFATTGAPPLAVFAWGEGGEIIDVDGNVQLDSPETIRGLEVADSIINSEFTMPDNEIQAMGVEQAFVQGLVGMFVGGANDGVERAVEEAGADFEVGMALVPAGSYQQVTFNWTASTVISAQTEHEEAARQALLDLTEAIFDWKVPTPVGSKLANIADINPYKEYAVDILLQASEMSRGFNNMPEQNELGSIQWDLLDSVIVTNNNGNGIASIPDLAADVADQLRDILE